ncbi:penicillin-binding protein 1C [Paracoccaceae bacterium]|nr:penicillin-binding protein 1C [Paracoccaceae bacterium]
MIKKVSIAITFGSLVLTTLWLGLYFSKEPDLGRLDAFSQVIRSEEGSIINLRLTPSGHWREKASLSNIDKKLVDMLVAYEDKRFMSHYGVDPIALIRATYNSLTSGSIVSGASTLTMQTVRLMHPELRERKITTKLRQMLEALRLERHFTKEEILEAYFSLAPYGGNIEGVEAASEAWFQKRPNVLTMSEAALLVALPQSPEVRRPDLFPNNAFKAKKLVLNKTKEHLVIDDVHYHEYISEKLPNRLKKPSSIAPHLADKFLTNHLHSIDTSISGNWQKELSKIIRVSVGEFKAPINAAAMVIERKTGDVKAYVGSSKYLEIKRKGAVNYLAAVRSPGSTLKPLIYAKALQRGFITTNHVYQDKIFHQNGYTPTNFDGNWTGEVTLKDALIRSLNIPAIETLGMLGAEQFEKNLRSFFGTEIGHGKEAGLSLAAGGFYMNAENLADLYVELADPGHEGKISFLKDEITSPNSFLINTKTSSNILSLLSQNDRMGRVMVFKTGTSHNRQDAWVVRLFSKHIVVVWIGTPDADRTEVLTGRTVALPISTVIAETLGLKPPKVQSFAKDSTAVKSVVQKECGKLINFPVDGEWIRSSKTVISVNGDDSAKWYLNGQPLKSYNRQIELKRAGVHKLTAVLENCSETSEVFLELAQN